MTTPERCFFIVGAALLASALLFVPILEPAFVREHLWCFDHFRGFPLGLRASLAILGFAICFDRINTVVWELWRRAAAPFGSPQRSRGIRPVLFGSILFTLFWLLRNRNFSLGDSAILLRYMKQVTLSKGYNVTFDEPLELLVHSGLFRLLHHWIGWDVERTYVLVSCLCGVAFVFLAIRIWNRIGTKAVPRQIVLGIFLSMGSMQLFFGHVENYSIVAVGMLSYVVLANAYLENRVRLIWPAIAIAFSFSLHVLAGWLFPSLLYLWLAKLRKRTPRENLNELFAAGAGFLAPIFGTIALCLSLGEPLERFKATHFAGMYFVFLLDESSRWFHFQFLSAGHLVAILNQVVLVALPGVLALAYVAIFYRDQIDLRDPFLHFLVLVASFFQIFAATWNPNIGPYKDFDLFSVVGLGYGLLGAYLLTRIRTSTSGPRRAGIVIMTFSLIQSSTFIVSNHGPLVEAVR
jgi:hypothetical protein